MASSDLKYLRNLWHRGKRANPRRSPLDNRGAALTSAGNQHRRYPQRSGGRKVKMLRVANVHRVMHADAQT